MTTWAPGRVATFAAGEWIVTVTSTGDVRIWRNGTGALVRTVLEVDAFDLRRVLGKIERAPFVRATLTPAAIIGSWKVGIRADGAWIEHWPQVSTIGFSFMATMQSVSDLREGLRKALDAIHSHHGTDLANLESAVERDARVAP